MNLKFLKCAIGLCVLISGLRVRAQASDKETVDLLLVFAVDVSLSVQSGVMRGPDELRLQRQGLVAALRAESTARLLEQCNGNGLAVTYIEWSGSDTRTMTEQVLPWRKIETQTDLQQFAQWIEQREGRAFNDATDVSSAIRFSHKLIEDAPFIAARQIISLSSDGRQNTTLGISVTEGAKMQSKHIALVRAARDEVVARGLTIDAIVILGDPSEAYYEQPLDQYYANHVIGGPRASMAVAPSFEKYSEHLIELLHRELNNCGS